MGIKIQGMEAVTKELERIRASMAPAMGAAIEDAIKYGEPLAIDTIFKRYGYRDRSYVAQHFSLSFNPKSLQGRISARMRPSTLTRFVSRSRTKAGKTGKQLPAGFDISVMRNEPTWFKGAFMFVGRNGNQLITSRKPGDTWRSLKKAKVLYGPSVAGSFGVIRDQIEPPIIKFLRERYQYHASK